MSRRIRLFEFQHQTWLPVWLRYFLADYLRYASQLIRVYRPAATILRSVIQTTGKKNIINLCSGGGGGLINLLPELNPSVKITLTDTNPNITAFEKLAEQHAAVSFVTEPVDAKHVSENLVGIRTLFTSFHHFTNEEAHAVLSDAAKGKAPICVFEATDLSIAALLGVFLIPLLSLIAAPVIRPFKFSRIFWTYAVPVIPLFLFWDGMVSVLRSYSMDDLTKLVQVIPDMEWEVGHLHASKRIRLTYLVGIPV